MMIVLCIAGAAALAVVAYHQLQGRSSEVATAGLRAVRELAAIVVVLVKAVEGVVDVLGGRRRVQAEPAGSRSCYRNSYEFDEEER